ncbi:hypothetical protein [Mesorhizobium loti]|uniref:hypothetical protein n=1 Tax=Rhizobium loti TaxID=381 RepID=UPI0011B8098A|nr:hypothetical protein [Mesorhizobium loti]
MTICIAAGVELPWGTDYGSGGQEFESLRAHHSIQLISLRFLTHEVSRYRLDFWNSAGFSAGFGRTGIPSIDVAAWRMRGWEGKRSMPS